MATKTTSFIIVVCLMSVFHFDFAFTMQHHGKTSLFSAGSTWNFAKSILTWNLAQYRESYCNVTESLSKKKVLILMSDTGGGHRASAQALNQAMGHIFPGKLDVEILDIWSKYGSWPFNKCVSTYKMLERNPRLWHGLYSLTGYSLPRKMAELWAFKANYNKFRTVIVERNPDIVISVHPLCQDIPLKVISEIKEKHLSNHSHIPFVTVVTDLGSAHPTWFDKRADLCYVPSMNVFKEAVKSGISEDKIRLTGLPLRSEFWKRAVDREKARKELGLKNNINTVLFMSGGDGIGNLDRIALESARKVSKLGPSSQFVIVCGHNQKLAHRMSKISWPRQIITRIEGFVPNVDKFMEASDCLVTKAGPGTIAEATTRGLPVIISSFLPGQVYFLYYNIFLLVAAVVDVVVVGKWQCSLGCRQWLWYF